MDGFFKFCIELCSDLPWAILLDLVFTWEGTYSVVQDMYVVLPCSFH